MPLEYQPIIISAATKKYLLDIRVEEVLIFQEKLFEFIKTRYPQIPESIRTMKEITEETEALLVKAIEECKTGKIDPRKPVLNSESQKKETEVKSEPKSPEKPMEQNVVGKKPIEANIQAKSTEKKTAEKKAEAKPTVKKTTTKKTDTKSAVKKPAAKKTTEKKTDTKPAEKKTTARKTSAKKPGSNKSPK